MYRYPGAGKTRLWDIAKGDFVAVQHDGISASPLQYLPVTEVLPDALIVDQGRYSVKDGRSLNGTHGRIIALGALVEEMGPAPSYGEAIVQEQQTQEALAEMEGRARIVLFFMSLQIADFQAIPFDRLVQAALLLGWTNGTKPHPPATGRFSLDGC